MKGKSLFKLISSIASLACVLLLCIVVVYAWYTSNKYVSTSGIQAESDSKDFTVVLQQLNTETMEFGPTLEMNNMNPGDIRYFKLTITNMVGKDSNFYARFEGISSTIDETEIFAKQGYVYTKYTLNNTVNELKLYDISSNKVVSNGKDLYLYSNDSLMLKDYLMQDMIEIYTYENKNNLTLSENHKMLSDKILFEKNTITKGGILEYYFALKFSDDATIEYAFQNLLIKALFVGLED